MVGIIILCVTIAAFIAIGLFLLIKGRKPYIPAGYKKTITKLSDVPSKNTAIVVVDKDVSVIKNKDTKEVENFVVSGELLSFERLANNCAKAMNIVATVMHKKGFDKADVNKAVFHILPDAKFDQNPYVRSAAAYSGNTGSMFGDGIPKITIREKYISEIIEKGKPALHEMIHVDFKASTGGYDSAHSNNMLWIKFGINTVEARAEQEFLK